VGLTLVGSLPGASQPEPRAIPISRWKDTSGYGWLKQAFIALTKGGLARKAPDRYELDGQSLYGTVPRTLRRILPNVDSRYTDAMRTFITSSRAAK